MAALRSKFLVLAAVVVVSGAMTASAALLPASIHVPVGPAPVWGPLDVAYQASLPKEFGLPEPSLLVVRTSEEWSALSAELRDAGMEVPYVNFETQFVAVRSLGQLTSEHRTFLSAASTDGGHVVLSFQDTVPNERGCHYGTPGQVGSIAVIAQPGAGSFEDVHVGATVETSVLPPEPTHTHWCHC